MSPGVAKGERPIPELPEVETVARQLRPRLVGRAVRGLRILDPRLRNERVPRVAGRRIREVTRSGKRVLIEFSPRSGGRDPLWLAVHLRMTGRLIAATRIEPGDQSYLRARFALDRGSLWFIDTRRFGTLDWFRNPDEAEPAGFDPLAPEFDPSRLADLLGSSRQPLKPWLLRQDRLVGLGNIYASEILHAARLSPFREAGSLTRQQVRRLHASTRKILERAIAMCGTTFSDFQDARGLEGSFQRFLRVYDCEDEPCRRCRAPVMRAVQQQRSTFYCPDCQT